jgi:hypothetical protein
MKEYELTVEILRETTEWQKYHADEQLERTVRIYAELKKLNIFFKDRYDMPCTYYKDTGQICIDLELYAEDHSKVISDMWVLFIHTYDHIEFTKRSNRANGRDVDTIFECTEQEFPAKIKEYLEGLNDGAIPIPKASWDYCK